MKKLTPKQRQEFKAKAHRLKPFIFIGNNGLSENVIKETQRALEDHELIKIRIQENDRDQRKALLDQLCELVDAYQVNLIGKIGVIYKESEKLKK